MGRSKFYLYCHYPLMPYTPKSFFKRCPKRGKDFNLLLRWVAQLLIISKFFLRVSPFWIIRPNPRLFSKTKNNTTITTHTYPTPSRCTTLSYLPPRESAPLTEKGCSIKESHLLRGTTSRGMTCVNQYCLFTDF